jgi:hypothetical protein
MTAPWRPPADALVASLRNVFGSRLLSVLVYGVHADGTAQDDPVSCLVLVESLTQSDLDACSRLGAGWRRQALATPLILPEQEFRRSLDAFPLEYAEIVRAHARVFGDDPFAEAVIQPEDLRRACEAQVKSHLVHLRQSYIEAGGKPHGIADLVVTSAPAFAALLRNVARLHGVATNDRTAATREGARVAGLGHGVVAEVLALESPPSVGATDPARLFPAYLATVEQLARFVDTWRG